MNYNKQEVKEGITLHQIDTKNFKTNLYAIFLATPITRENVTRDALISAVLRRGTNKIKSQELISQEFEAMYGATFDCGIEKTGDNHIFKFYVEALSDEFLPTEENLAKKSLEILLDIVFNPLIENNGFKAEYVEGEKKNIKQIIESKIDNKGQYSLDKCIEETFKGEPYGLYKYGYVEDLEKITPQDLYKYYKKMISECKIDIFCSGILKNVEKIIKENENIKNLEARKANYVIDKKHVNNNKAVNYIQESMQVSQGKLVISLKIGSNIPNLAYIASIYNAILGGGANSRLFQNVREKESLAYTAGSNYLKQKNVIFIRCGIEIENYEKALETIKVQIENLKKGEITEEDIENAKKLIIASVKSITSEQDTEITYYYGQELSGTFTTITDYENKVNSVTKEQIVEIANSVSINTIYFLKD